MMLQDSGTITRHDLYSQAINILEWMKEIRRDIHRIAEPAFQEKRTSEYVCDILSRLRIPFKNNIARTGIVAFLGPEDQDNGVVALRADMDALPVEEKTGLPFSSTNPGFMHACGHDGHVAMLLGAARLLKESGLVRGQIRLLFQPAEEGQGGAVHMIREGCLKGCRLIFGGHIDCHFKVGEIAVQQGLICAFADGLLVKIKGQGGHAARPHEARDAIMAASHFIVTLQSVINKRINPQYPALVSIGQIQGGSAPNAIAEEVILKGTIRTTHNEIRQEVFREISNLKISIEKTFGVDITLEYPDHYPPVINSPEATEIARTVVEELFGAKAVLPYPIPSLGGEDFSFYLQEIPGCFVRFGAKKEGHENAPAHSPHFDFNEDVLAVGAAFFAKCALSAMVIP